MSDKQTVYVAMYKHKNGTDVRVFTTHNAACQWKADYAQQLVEHGSAEELDDRTFSKTEAVSGDRK